MEDREKEEPEIKADEKGKQEVYVKKRRHLTSRVYIFEMVNANKLLNTAAH